MRTTFKKDMVVTVEPGLYVPNKWGVRIEDTCHITVNGCEPLTNTSKKIIVIQKNKI
jgi:Xaa-Pro aminopeptidase